MVKDYIGSVLDGDNGFTSRGKHWDASTLRDASKDLIPFDLDLMSIDLSINPWQFNTWNYHTFLFHMARIEKANLAFPIIQDESGFIIDGWHRVAKAIMSGYSTIKAVRLKVMPEADEILNNE